MPKFSIISISKNHCNDLKNTFQSVIDQTFRDFEYIVIDGNSDDGSIDLLNRWNNHIDKLIIEEDEGIYDAMNKGIKYSSGDYIFFLNIGDHLATRESLAAANQKIETHKAEIYFGKIIWVDTINRNVITSKHEHVRNKSQLLYENFPHPATIYTKQAFEKYGLFNTRYPVFADYEWNLRALLNNNASYYYGDFIMTTFYTGGVSTNTENLEAKQKEKELLRNYYRNKLYKNLLFGRSIREKWHRCLKLDKLNKVQ